MNRERCRTIGSILGLVVALSVMFLLGIYGMIPGALFGAGGAVVGGIGGEKFFDRRHRG